MAMKVLVTAKLGDEEIAAASGMLRESIEFVMRSIQKQCDNGLLESLNLIERNDAAAIQIIILRR